VEVEDEAAEIAIGELASLAQKAHTAPGAPARSEVRLLGFGLLRRACCSGRRADLLCLHRGL